MLLFLDGFDNLTAAQAVSTAKWAAYNGLAEDADNGRFEYGQALMGNDDGHYIERAIGSNLASGCIGVACKVAPGANAQLLIVTYDGTSPQLVVKHNADRTLSIMRNTTVLGTSTYQTPSNSYFYLELLFNINNSIGTDECQLYVNGTSVVNLSATTDTQDTSNAYITKYRLGGDTGVLTGTVNTFYFDDHYFIDLTGTYNNAPLGEVRVQYSLPSAEGDSSGFVGSDNDNNDNFALVADSEAHDGSTTYVQAAVPDLTDTYEIADLDGATTTVLGIQTNIVARKTDTADKTIAPVLRVNLTDYPGTTTGNIASDYTSYLEVFEENPDTTAAWDVNEINASQFGMKVVS